MVSNGGFETLESAHVLEDVTFEHSCNSSDGGVYVFYSNHSIGWVYHLGVPDNMYGIQQPHGGEKYGGAVRLYYYNGSQTACEQGGKIIFHLNEQIHKGYHYTLKFFTSHMDNSDVEAQLKVSLDNDQSVFDFSLSDKINWQQKTVTFTADNDYNDLVFEVTNTMLFTNNLTGVYIDDVSLAMTCQLEHPCSSENPVMSPSFSGSPITQTNAFKIDNLDNVHSYTILIRNLLSDVVYSNSFSCETGIDQPMYWKGINNSGSPVANGPYTFEVTTVNDCGSRVFSGGVFKSATFTGSLTEPSCIINEYIPSVPCCVYEPTLLIDDHNWISETLVFHSTQNILASSIAPVIVNDFSDVTMRAGERVELLPGFSTVDSRMIRFVGEIVPCPEMRLALEEDTEQPTIQSSESSKSVPESVFNVYPNPNSGSFTIAGNQLMMIIITEASGKMVRQLNGGMADRVSVDGLGAGLYIVQAQMADGRVENAKVVVN